MAGEYGPPNPLYPLLLLAMHSRPGLAEELENLSTLLGSISSSVKGMQTSMNLFHTAVRNATSGKTVTPPPPAPSSAQEKNGDDIKETVKNLEALFARMKKSTEDK